MKADAPKDLVRQFQLGNTHAFKLLFEQYRVPIFNFVYRMLNGDRESAEDLLSEIFMKLHNAREFYEPKARFSTWLFTIARNHCLNRVWLRLGTLLAAGINLIHALKLVREQTHDPRLRDSDD